MHLYLSFCASTAPALSAEAWYTAGVILEGSHLPWLDEMPKVQRG